MNAETADNNFPEKKEAENIQNYALVSVYDKEKLIPLARSIEKAGFKIISTGGTSRHLQKKGISFVPVEKISGSPELFNGRMKTISFKIESGILFDRNNTEHIRQAKKYKIPQIDLVVCNLYPFKEMAEKEMSIERSVEYIDVGGPTMIRAAAKNFKHVLVVPDVIYYDEVIERLEEGKIDDNFRRYMASQAFTKLSGYDYSVSYFLLTGHF